jgi:hypothetical protein
MPPLFQFSPYQSQHVGTIAELMMAPARARASGMREAAAAEAQGTLQQGQIRGQMIGTLGQLAGGAVQQYGEQQQAEQQRQAIGAALQAVVNGEAGPDALLAAGDDGTLLKALGAYSDLATGRVKNAQETAGRLAMGLKVLPPEQRQQLWPQVRQAAIKGGLGDEQTLPADATDEFLDAVIAWGTGKTQEPRSLIQRDPTKDLADPVTGEVRVQGVPEVKEPPVSPAYREYLDARREGYKGTFLQYQNEDANRKRPVTNVTMPGQEPVVAVVGPDGNPVYVPRSRAVGMRPANQREQGRAVTSGDAGRIAEFDTSLDDLKVLRDTVLPIDPKTGKATTRATGTSAKIGAMLPNAVTDLTGWGTEAKSKQAVIDRVKQVIGKALEGGVLRKEDEYKYEKILPTIADTSEVVATKLAGLERAIRLRRQTQLDALEDAGYDVSRFLERAPHGGGAATTGGPGVATTAPADVTALLGNQPPGRYTLTDGSVWVKDRAGRLRKE